MRWGESIMVSNTFEANDITAQEEFFGKCTFCGNKDISCISEGNKGCVGINKSEVRECKGNLLGGLK